MAEDICASGTKFWTDVMRCFKRNVKHSIVSHYVGQGLAQGVKFSLQYFMTAEV